MRKIIQDIIIRKKYSVKDGEVSFKKAEIYNEKSSQSKPVKDPKIYQETVMFGDKQKNNSRVLIWSVSVISLIALFFVFSYVFSSAEILITPKTEKISLSNTWPIMSDKNADGLHYQIISLTQNLTKGLVTDGEEYVEKKATGKVIVYNNYSSQTQRLISNTRLQALSGLIYRVRDSAEVPGYKIVKGVKTPGSVEIDIIADSAGDKFNMKLSDFKGDFKIPGFKGSPKYNDFYGRLNSDVTGGFIGNVKKVSPDTVSVGRDELKKNLSESLLKSIYASLPDSSVVFKDNYFIQYSELPDDSSGKDLKINEEGVIHAIAFDRDELANYIAKQKIKSFDGGKVELVFSGITATTSGNTDRQWLENSLKLSISGNSMLVWKYNENAILQKIIGNKKSIVTLIAKENKNSIVSIVARIQPMWFTTFPTAIKKIQVIDTVRENIK